VSTQSSSLHLRLPPGALDEAGLAALHQALTDYAQRLAEGLGLPDARRLTLQVTPDAAPAAWLWGRETQVLALPEGASAPALTGVAALALFRARDRLWTPARARALWHRQPIAPDAARDAAFIARLLPWLRTTARQGLRAGRLLAALAQDTSAPDANALDAAFEQAATGAAPATLGLSLAPAQHRAWLSDGSGARAAQALAGDLYDELGLLWRIAPAEADTALEPPWFRLRLNDVELPPLPGLAEGETLGWGSSDRRAMLGMHAPDSGFGWGPAQAALQGAAMRLARQEAAALVDTRLVALMLTSLGAWPRLVKLAQAGGGPERIAPVLRRLVDEQVSVLDLRSLLESLLAPQAEVAESVRHIVIVAEGPTPLWRVPGVAGERPAAAAVALACPYPDCGRPVLPGRRFCQSCRREMHPCPRCSQPMAAPEGPCPGCRWPADEPAPAPAAVLATAAEAAQGVRLRLRRQCALRWCASPGTLEAVLLAPAMEQRLARAARSPLRAAEAEAMRLAVRQEVGPLANTHRRLVMLTTVGARLPLRELLRLEWPELPVVCYQELHPSLNIVPLGRVPFGARGAAT
jgi:hypothetical protein